MKSTPISEFINQDYRDYALHVLHERAIPDFYDGMNPTQRKIFYTCKKLTSDGQYRLMLNLIGGVFDTGYHHGDKSCYDVFVNMAREYRINNINLIDGKGAYGNRLVNRASAARYIQARYSAIAEHIFLDNDLLEPCDDPQASEPKRYFPIIPMVIVNEKNNIATGFACKIPPANPLDIIDNMIYLLRDKPERLKEIKPYWRNYDLEIKRADTTQLKYIVSGKYKRLTDKKILVTELPPSYERIDYIKILEALKEKETISNYVDNSKGNKFEFEIKFKESINESTINKILRLDENYTYNLTVIKDDKVKTYQDINSIIMDFIYWRLTIYDARHAKILLDLKELRDFYESKKVFVNRLIDYLRKTKSIKKDEIGALIDNQKYRSKFMSIPVHEISDESLVDIENKIRQIDDEIKKYENINPKSEYIKELINLKNKLEKLHETGKKV